jgi:hypothetical protein
MSDGNSNGGDNINSLGPGDDWPHHYRGYQFSVSPSGDVWWQAYNGTDRLELKPTPDTIVDHVQELKRNGGRIHITEAGRALTKIETDQDNWQEAYLGELDFQGNLVPTDTPSRRVTLTPTGLTPGDLWPSIYDGAKYSFSGDRFWWEHSDTNLRHSFANPLPQTLTDELKRLRPNGGSFRITPNGAVLTQIPTAKSPANVRDQFRDLPREIKRVLKLRRDRGNVDMLPVYVGTLSNADRPIEVKEPTRLSDPLSQQEEADLESWAASMDSYSETELDEDNHRLGGDQ